ncbi:MAG TPA: diacylglycerol kinase [Lactobacillaceae bacterium]|jgi:diacylglycerol kinase (ATP)
MKRARLIYNPTSGREAIKRDLLDILQVYEQAGYETSAFATTAAPFSAANEARRAAEAGFELIVAAGGDGTINEVINGLAPLEKRPKMAILPSGTTNDYARALKIPRDDLLDAAKVILQEQTIKMDIGEIQTAAQTQYFMNIAALGTLSEVTYAVPSVMKSMYGYLAYLVKGAELLTRVKPITARVTFDDGEFEGDISMIFLALTNSVGGFEQIVPDAKLDDGKFTLLIVKQSNLGQLFNLVAKALNGKHTDDPQLIYKKTNQVRIEPLTNDALAVNIDGEYGGVAPMTFVNLQQHIEFVANTTGLSADALTHVDIERRQVEQKFIEEVEKEQVSDDK